MKSDNAGKRKMKRSSRKGMIIVRLDQKYPKIAQEWHPTKNGEKVPAEISPYDREKFWWKCSAGHEWNTAPRYRCVGTGRGCPYCRGIFITKENCLATKNPALAAEWHPKKNGAKKPEQFRRYSTQKVWWKCKNGHAWQAEISRRTGGAGCPVCLKQKREESKKKRKAKAKV